MITKTSKEVLMHAMQLAGVNNINFLNFFNVVTLENNLYRQIYEKIATAEDSYFDCEFTFSGNRCILPDDVWMIKRVISESNGIKKDLSRMAGQTSVPGQWYLSNNELIITSNDMENVRVVYAPQPTTLTIPDAPQVLNIDKNKVKRFIGMNDTELWYEDTENAGHTYNFKDELDTITEEVKEKPTTNIYDYCGGKLTLGDGVYTFDDEDVTDVLSQGKTILKVVVCDPYLAVTYDDRTIKIFNGWACADYNLFAYKGRKTLGEIESMCTNDYTGKGVVFFSDFDNKLLYCSFVPDTVLNYPEQADFSLLELKLALQLANMAGTNTSWIQEQLEETEMSFEKQLMRGRASTLRINNIRAQHPIFGY